MWAELKKRVRARKPTNLTQLHQLCQEEWVKIHPSYSGKLVEGYPKHFTQVKQFKGRQLNRHEPIKSIRQIVSKPCNCMLRKTYTRRSLPQYSMINCFKSVREISKK
ncbi:unnamed protein product [Oncorhynchus mykiss]|uniref:Uncharacterized protein n=1 Tax=Oncorhynchus mykiss TaxID=8022 RepID=A0A060WC94_ONCMY|nr:unnamed protein product [Oncorhynchus mykiss]